MKRGKLVNVFVALGLAAVGSVIVTTITDTILMGHLTPKFRWKPSRKNYVIHKENRFDLQKELECSAYSSAYVLRHFGIEAAGSELYKEMPDKMEGGAVYPKGIIKMLGRYGIKATYCIGNLAALKEEVAKGNPVIVMIKGEAKEQWLHYVPVVGFTEDKIYVAESLGYLVNQEAPYYNREISIDKFKKLWNTSMRKMPLYRNTFFTIEKK